MRPATGAAGRDRPLTSSRRLALGGEAGEGVDVDGRARGRRGRRPGPTRRRGGRRGRRSPTPAAARGRASGAPSPARSCRPTTTSARLPGLQRAELVAHARSAAAPRDRGQLQRGVGAERSPARRSLASPAAARRRAARRRASPAFSASQPSATRPPRSTISAWRPAARHALAEAQVGPRAVGDADVPIEHDVDLLVVEVDGVGDEHVAARARRARRGGPAAGAPVRAR